jgi:hypothetical protein
MNHLGTIVRETKIANLVFLLGIICSSSHNMFFLMGSVSDSDIHLFKFIYLILVASDLDSGGPKFFGEIREK